jgi:septum formation protein
MKITLPPLILASKSPRRQQILKDLGLPFRVAVKDVIETYPDALQAEEIADYLCQLKADAMDEMAQDHLVMTADTIVWQDEGVLGKPADRNDAIRILTRLAGKSHRVITGVCLSYQGKRKVFTQSTEVWFRRMNPERLAWYVDHFPVMDKAGAYGVQDWIGLAGVERIQGDFYNVMGLPAGKLVEVLEEEYILHFDTPL